jgi:hypothetical protein
MEPLVARFAVKVEFCKRRTMMEHLVSTLTLRYNNHRRGSLRRSGFSSESDGVGLHPTVKGLQQPRGWGLF